MAGPFDLAHLVHPGLNLDQLTPRFKFASRNIGLAPLYSGVYYVGTFSREGLECIRIL